MLRMRKFSAVRSEVDQLRHHQTHFLFTLSKLTKPGEKGVKASDMSKALHITRGAITHIINDMEANGLIERVSDLNDRRIVLICPTELGKQRMDDSFDHIKAHIEDVANFLGEKDTEEFRRILSRIVPYLIEKMKVREEAVIHHHGEPNE